MWVLALALSAGGCTRLLGIDGHYVDEIEGAGGRSNGSRDAAPPSFDSGAGGIFVQEGAGGSSPVNSAGGQNESGGTTAVRDAGSGGTAASAGGTGVTGPGGAPDGAGGTCASCMPPLGSCTAGTYRGTQKGSHSPSVTFVGVPLTVTGTVVFRLLPNDAGTSAQILDGQIDGTVGVAGNPTFQATIGGTVDCQTGRFDASLDGKYSLTPNTPGLLAFSGTYTGTFSGKSFSGTWSESEPVAGPVAGTYPYKGSGTWSATWSTP